MTCPSACVHKHTLMSNVVEHQVAGAPSCVDVFRPHLYNSCALRIGEHRLSTQLLGIWIQAWIRWVCVFTRCPKRDCSRRDCQCATSAWLLVDYSHRSFSFHRYLYRLQRVGISFTYLYDYCTCMLWSFRLFCRPPLSLSYPISECSSPPGFFVSGLQQSVYGSL